MQRQSVVRKHLSEFDYIFLKKVLSSQNHRNLLSHRKALFTAVVTTKEKVYTTDKTLHLEVNLCRFTLSSSSFSQGASNYTYI